jgi:tetratricopeptide (TPR) repeat protein
MTFLKKSWLLYLILIGISFLLIDRTKIIYKALDYENGIPAFLLEFAQNQGGSFPSPRAEQSLRYYRNLIKLYPDSPYVHGALAFCYYHYGNFNKAARHFQKAVALDPDSFGLYYNLGMTYLRQKNVSKARECFQKAVEKSPTKDLSYWEVVSPYEEINGLDQNKKRILGIKRGYDELQRLINQTMIDEVPFSKGLYYFPPIRFIDKSRFVLI